MQYKSNQINRAFCLDWFSTDLHYFILGRQIYSFNTNELEEGYPKPLTSLGLPESIDKIDAALVWGHNNKTYIYSGTMYWRYDEDEGHVELDYPRDMSIWRGIPYDIDSAFQYKDGKLVKISTIK